MNSQLFSSYWLDDSYMTDLSTKDKDPIKLAKYQRVISNFVRILTKQSIPVEYRNSGDSYTDSHQIVIGSTIDEKNFDSVVGLALHEASHIKLTDFRILPNLYGVLRELGLLTDELDSQIYDHRYEFKGLLNYIEDRRIDRYVYTTSPGYKGYYQSLYDRYFNDKVIDKMLQSDEYRDLTLESYFSRIINLVNEHSDLDALPDLRNIHNIIFSEVPKMTSTTDALRTTVKVWELIMKNIKKGQEPNSEDDESGESQQGDENQDNGIESDNQQGQSQSSDDEQSDSQSQESNGGSDSDGEPREQLTPHQQKMLPKKLEKQRKFLEGDIQKGKISKELSETVKSLQSPNTEIKEIEYDNEWNDKQTTEVVILHGITDSNFNIFDNMMNNRTVGYHSDEVTKGILLGKKLGKKLQIRNRERQTDINRQKKGRIEKRRLHAIGAGDHNIFYQSLIEKHSDAFLHLSIDGSGSMAGSKFKNSLISAIAIAQMGSMTNIDVQISFRYTETFGNTQKPIMWVAYDSRKQSIKDIKKYFHRFVHNGLTPEGLCFESIMKQLPTGTDSFKTYFINYSDGAPYFQGYGGQTAVIHTKKQVVKLRENGYTVLSFFITDSGYNSPSEKQNFQTMYGKDASFIDPTSLPKLVKQLQTMFINEK